MRVTTMAMISLPVIAVLTLPGTWIWYELGKETPGGPIQFGWHFSFVAEDETEADLILFYDPSQPAYLSGRSGSGYSWNALACVRAAELTCLATEIEGQFSSRAGITGSLECSDETRRSIRFSVAEGMPFGPPVTGDIALAKADGEAQLFELVRTRKFEGEALRLLCPGRFPGEETVQLATPELRHAA